MTTIVIADLDLQEIETCQMDCSMVDAMNIIDRATVLNCGNCRKGYTKTGFMSVDLAGNKILVQVNFRREENS